MEVQVQENTKVVTLRSVYQVINETLYPLELTLVDDAGQPMYSVEKIGMIQQYALEDEAMICFESSGPKLCPSYRSGEQEQSTSAARP